MTRLQRAIREGLVLILCAAVLGFAFSAIRDKGLFAKDTGRSTSALPGGSPTMIQLPEAVSLFEQQQALFIDARSPYDFARGHIRGAVNIPLHEVGMRGAAFDALPRDKVLITYCDGVECNSSIGLAAHLRELGFTGVRIFFGGWNEWQQQNLPSETGTP
jgi:rhodanese-related sulfurtransferase